jgi:hypothetical protein
LAKLLLRKDFRGAPAALYVEQPYACASNGTFHRSAVASPLKPLLGAAPAWRCIPTDRPHRRAKIEAVRAYRSQLRHLGLRNIGLRRMLWQEAARGGEAIAWVPRFEHRIEARNPVEEIARTASGDPRFGACYKAP